MRVFHQLVFDETVVGTTAVYTAADWNPILSVPDKLRLVCLADQVSGSSPTITVAIEESADNRNFVQKNSPAEINAQSLSTSATNLFAGYDNASTIPTGGLVRLKVTLGGTTPIAHVRLWVTGRGEVVMPMR